MHAFMAKKLSDAKFFTKQLAEILVKPKSDNEDEDKDEAKAEADEQDLKSRRGHQDTE